MGTAATHTNVRGEDASPIERELEPWEAIPEAVLVEIEPDAVVITIAGQTYRLRATAVRLATGLRRGDIVSILCLGDGTLSVRAQRSLG